MNRTIKETTVQRCHYPTTVELNQHLQAFPLAYNHAKRPKTLRGLTPHEFACAQSQTNPAIYTRDPTHLTLKPYTYSEGALFQGYSQGPVITIRSRFQAV